MLRQHPSAIFLSYKQKIKCLSKPNEQDIQYPITCLIFVIIKWYVFTHVSRVKAASSYIYFVIVDTFVEWLQCNSFARVQSHPSTYLIIQMSFMRGIGEHYLK